MNDGVSVLTNIPSYSLSLPIRLRKIPPQHASGTPPAPLPKEDLCSTTGTPGQTGPLAAGPRRGAAGARRAALEEAAAERLGGAAPRRDGGAEGLG